MYIVYYVITPQYFLQAIFADEALVETKYHWYVDLTDGSFVQASVYI